jgi:hypothetical protein
VPERFAAVEAVDWAVLEPFGSPEEVPAALHAVWSPDPEARRAAYEELGSLLNYGEQRSPASAVAVPFLVDVVADPAAPDRFAAMQVLLGIAIGEEEAWLLGRTDAAAERAEVAHLWTLSVPELWEIEYAWVAAAATVEERAAREWTTKNYTDVEAIRQSRQWCVTAYDAVLGHVPTLVTLLDSLWAADRLWAAYLLAYFPEERAVILPALSRVIVADPDPATAAVGCVAAGFLASDTEDEALLDVLLTRYRRARTTAERWSAAIGVALVSVSPRAEILAEVAAAARAEEALDNWPFLNGDVAAIATLTLQHRRASQHA